MNMPGIHADPLELFSMSIPTLKSVTHQERKLSEHGHLGQLVGLFTAQDPKPREQWEPKARPHATGQAQCPLIGRLPAQIAHACRKGTNCTSPQIFLFASE